MALEPDRFGYSPIIDRPKFTWPGGARLVLLVAPNLEHWEHLPEPDHDGV